MAMVNVNRENPDQFYRYKMPLILAKVGSQRVITIVVILYCPHTWIPNYLLDSLQFLMLEYLKVIHVSVYVTLEWNWC